ncbi:MAG TPA: GxxExxY protein [Casimicrobiaceae bacterium]|nr:GxxExxY protein [Casimicrobiaceae bacterium]
MRPQELVEGALTRSIIGAFYEVYNTLDFGFLEHIYKEALAKELRALGHRVEREVRVVVYYKGEPIAVQIIDMIVDGKVVVEAKASAEVRPAWGRQLQNYLRATDLEVGLLLHFGLEAKFYRAVELRSRKLRKGNADTDSTDLTDSTDRSSNDHGSISQEP